MFKKFGIFVLVCTLNGVFADDIPDECKNHRTFKAAPHSCCEIPRLVTVEDEKACGIASDTDIMMESQPRPPGPPSCDKEICILKKYDLISGDDKVNKDAIKAFLKNWSSNNSDFEPVVESIKSECIDKDVSAMGPPDACEPLKIRHCIMKTVLLECPKWKATEECTEMKQHIDKCKQYYKKAK